MLRSRQYQRGHTAPRLCQNRLPEGGHHMAQYCQKQSGKISITNNITIIIIVHYLLIFYFDYNPPLYSRVIVYGRLPLPLLLFLPLPLPLPQLTASKNRRGETPLLLAVRHGRLSAAKELLSRCDVWAVDDTNPRDRHRTCLQSLLARVDDR